MRFDEQSPGISAISDPSEPVPTPLPHRNVLYQGDCLDILARLPAGSVDMILCDLPYGTTQNKWDSVIDLGALWKEYRRIAKPNAPIVLTSQGVFTAQLIMAQPKLFAYKLVWEKSKATNFLNAKKQPLRKHEDVCVFYAKQPTYNPQMTKGTPYDKGVRKDQHTGSYGGYAPAEVKSDGKRYPTDVIYFKTAESEPERTVWHPTQKPIDLGRYLIRTYTNPGDLVLDNCFGSGSFLLAAHMEGRDYLGIELNENAEQFRKDAVDYVGIAEQRLVAHGATPDVIRDIDPIGS